MRAFSLPRALLVAMLVLLAQPLVAGPALAAGTGGVLAWGDDSFDQLGDGGENAQQPTPVAVSGLGTGSSFLAVAAGADHSLAIRADGAVLAWGDDVYGQLGDDEDLVQQPTPVVVSGLGAGSGVVAIAAGTGHSMALRSDGTVLAWGDDIYGQLGDGGENVERHTPVTVTGLGAGSGVVAIAAGSDHSLAVRSNGSVLAWGDDFYEQLGDGQDLIEQTTPVAVSGLGAGSGVVKVAGGRSHSLALRSNGNVLAWGDDLYGQLGDGGEVDTRPTPVSVSGLGAGSGVVHVAAGADHSLAVRANGSVLAWGDDFFGQLGDGGENLEQTTPVGVSGLGVGSGVVAVDGGDTHSLAVRSNGSVLAWGDDSFGQLGDGGENLEKLTPVAVSGLGAESDVVAVAAGAAHSLAATTATTPGSTFAPLSPERVWDSRRGPGPIGRLGAGQTRNVTVTSFAGAPPTGVTAVVLNVTAVGPSTGTYVTAWPAGETKPLASNLNVPPGDTRANLVIVKVGAGGQVSFYNNAGTTDLIADVAGWYGAAAGQRYTSVTPERVWDSRNGPGPLGRIGPGQTRNVSVTSFAEAPASGVTAVVLNVTAVSPSASTYVTAWPTGEPKPLASNLNVPPGDTRPNLVIVKVGVGGQVSFYNDAGTTDLIADVAGYYSATGSSLNSVLPERVWDSRNGPGPLGRIGAGQTRNVSVTDLAGVPATGVTAVVLNVTAVDPAAATYVTAWPAGQAKPLASNLNVPPGDTRANLVIVKVGVGGQVSFYNDAGSVDLIADVAGWYGAAGV